MCVREREREREREKSRTTGRNVPVWASLPFAIDDFDTKAASFGLLQAFGMKIEGDPDCFRRAMYSSLAEEPYSQSYSIDEDGAINLCEEEEEEEEEEDKKVDVDKSSIACTNECRPGLL